MTKAKNEVSLKMKTNPRPPPPSPEFPHFYWREGYTQLNPNTNMY